jgi:hypothetical protein
MQLLLQAMLQPAADPMHQLCRHSRMVSASMTSKGPCASTGSVLSLMGLQAGKQHSRVVAESHRHPRPCTEQIASDGARLVVCGVCGAQACAMQGRRPWRHTHACHWCAFRGRSPGASAWACCAELCCCHSLAVHVGLVGS